MSAKFELLAEGLGVGRPPSGWVAIVDMPVLVLVGVTGVGKSTAVDALRTRMDGLSLLPNRRKLADLLVIPSVQGWGRGAACPGYGPPSALRLHRALPAAVSRWSCARVQPAGIAEAGRQRPAAAQ